MSTDLWAVGHILLGLFYTESQLFHEAPFVLQDFVGGTPKEWVDLLCSLFHIIFAH